jgi:hypothetical protein
MPMSNEAYQRIVDALKSGPDNVGVTATVKTMLEALVMVQQKQLQQHEQLMALIAAVERLQAASRVETHA